MRQQATDDLPQSPPVGPVLISASNCSTSRSGPRPPRLDSPGNRSSNHRATCPAARPARRPNSASAVNSWRAGRRGRQRQRCEQHRPLHRRRISRVSPPRPWTAEPSGPPGAFPVEQRRPELADARPPATVSTDSACTASSAAMCTSNGVSYSSLSTSTTGGTATPRHRANAGAAAAACPTRSPTDSTCSPRSTRYGRQPGWWPRPPVRSTTSTQPCVACQSSTRTDGPACRAANTASASPNACPSACSA